MNLIEQLQTDVARHQRQLEEQEARLEGELAETRKALRSAKSYQAKLLKQHPNGEATLPLADPDEEPEALPDMLAEDWEPTDTGAPPPSDYEPTWEDSKDAADRAEASLMIEEAKAKTVHRRKPKAAEEE